MEKIKGKPITCSTCGLAGHTLVKDGKGGYKHERPTICAQVMRSQPKRQTIIPTREEVMKYAKPTKPV